MIGKSKSKQISVQLMIGPNDDQSQLDKSSTCDCGGVLLSLDSFERSETTCCRDCREVYLVYTAEDGRQEVVRLRNCDQRRGNGWGRRSLDDYQMANKLLEYSEANKWPTPAIATDVCIAPHGLFSVLQRCEVSHYDLDRVLGDGEAITKLVNVASAEPVPELAFETELNASRIRETEHDAAPTVHATSSWVWYVLEYDPETKTYFGFADGFDTELEYFNLKELSSIQGPQGERVQRDLHFTPTGLSGLQRDHGVER